MTTIGDGWEIVAAPIREAVCEAVLGVVTPPDTKLLSEYRFEFNGYRWVVTIVWLDAGPKCVGHVLRAKL